MAPFSSNSPFKPNNALKTSQLIAPRPGRTQLGVTRLELLLLLLTFGIVLGVLVPVSGKLKEQGRENTCASNLEHLGTAVNQYVTDNDGLYPCAWQSDLTSHINAGQLKYWPYAIYPFVKDRRLYKCPDDTRNAACSYLINSWGVDAQPTNTKSLARRTSSIFLPSRFVLLTEGANLEGGDADPNLAVSGHGLNTDYTLANFADRISSPDRQLPWHGQHLLFLYFDGHSGVSPELPEIVDKDYDPVKVALPFSRYFDDRGGDWSQ